MNVTRQIRAEEHLLDLRDTGGITHTEYRQALSDLDTLRADAHRQRKATALRAALVVARGAGRGWAIVNGQRMTIGQMRDALDDLGEFDGTQSELYCTGLPMQANTYDASERDDRFDLGPRSLPGCTVHGPDCRAHSSGSTR